MTMKMKCLKMLMLLVMWVGTVGASDHGAAHCGGDHCAEAHVPHYHVFHVDFESVEVPFIIALWIFVSSLAKIGFHMTPKLHHIFPESCLLIVVGIIIGFLLFLTSEHPPTTLTPPIFFLFMLPPIILDAGYFMPNRLFFDHLGTILLMAVVGTVFNVLTIGVSLWAVGQTGLYGEHAVPGILETFLFSSLISAVDPVAVLAVFEEIQVNEVLYIVVFGESLLNDAVTVVLYHMFEAYVEIEEENLVATDILKGCASFLVVAVGGTVVGVFWGYVTGFVTRFTHHARVLEPLFVFTMAYLSYLTAEIFHMSGILAITFCGITMKNYVERNVSTKSQTTIKYAIKMLSSSSETIIFMFLGVATIHDAHDWNWWFVTFTILFCTVYRGLGVLILSAIANQYRLHKLTPVDQFVMMYGGLRGAVAFALVLLIKVDVIPHAHMFVTTTIAVVYWTVFVQGITIKPLVKFLNVKTSAEKEPSMNERITGRFMDHIVSGMEGILGEFGNLRIRDIYKQIDNKYIKPCLLRENHVKDPKIIETYEAITNNDVAEYMKRNPSQFSVSMNKPDLKSSKSVAQIFNASPTVTMDHLDMKEITFNQSRKDLTEAKIHHLLSENMVLPRKREKRRLSLSKFQLPEDEDVDHRVQNPVRRMMSEKKHVRKRKIRKNPTIPEIVKDDDVEGRVLGSSKELMDDRVHKMMAEDMEISPPPYAPDDQGLSFTAKTLTVPSIRTQQRKSEIRSLLDHTTTLADDHKPAWMQTHPSNNNKSYENPAYDPSADEVVTTTVSQDVLPWKREGDPIHPIAMKQREFPSWIDNRDHFNHNSPSNTLLGRASEHRTSILDFNFSKRDSITEELDVGSRRGSRHFEDKDFLKVLTNSAGLRRVSAPPLRQRQISKPNLEVGGNMSPMVERRKNFLDAEIVLNIENEMNKM